MLTQANFVLFISVWISKEGCKVTGGPWCWLLIQTPCCRLSLNLPSVCTFISSGQWPVPSHLNEVFCRCPSPGCLTRMNLWSVPLQGSYAARFDLRLAELTALSVHPCCLSLPGDRSRLVFRPSFVLKKPVKLLWVKGYLVRCFSCFSPHWSQGREMASVLPSLHVTILCVHSTCGVVVSVGLFSGCWEHEQHRGLAVRDKEPPGVGWDDTWHLLCVVSEHMSPGWLGASIVRCADRVLTPGAVALVAWVKLAIGECVSGVQ